MLLDCKDLTPQQVYFLMIQTIIPRPIAWVLSDNGNGSYNLAPFSFFNGITDEPPILMIAVGWKDDATRKDTWVNIEEREDFVVHIPTEEMAGVMVASSSALPHGESEVSRFGLATVAVEGHRLPRVAGPKAAFFCKKHKIIEVGTAPQALILGEITKIWLDESVVRLEKGRVLVDPLKMAPVARLGGSGYAALGRVFDVRRPE